MNPVSYLPKPPSIIYAPWRATYEQPINKEIAERSNNDIKLDTQKEKKCVFCSIAENLKNSNGNIVIDRQQNFILYQGQYNSIMLASAPYINNGYHFLIVPYEHIREATELGEQTWNEINLLTQMLCVLFSSDCYEFIVNTNFGFSAGATVPAHHHRHVLVKKFPRAHSLIEAMKQTTSLTVDLQSTFIELQSIMKNFRDIQLPSSDSKQNDQKIEVKGDCYFCSVMSSKEEKENLILHRGKYSVAMISHYPTYGGEVDIFPIDHIDSLELMTPEAFSEINKLIIIIYPLVLKILNYTDCNIGFISYGKMSAEKEHLRFRIIPRRNYTPTPITGSNHQHINIHNFYETLKSMLVSELEKADKV